MSLLPTLTNNAVIYEGNPEHFASSAQTGLFIAEGRVLRDFFARARWGMGR